jgi:hypothetical protein
MNCTTSCRMTALPLALLLGCSGSGSAVLAPADVGGASATGGNSNAMGGGTAASGSTSLGGALATGGAYLAGGAVTTGGIVSVGGTVAAGGSEASTGGTVSTGGARPTGGTMSVGGAVNTGGAVTTGGVVSTGGSKASTGGVTTTGGSKATTGGKTAAGGTGGIAAVGGTTSSGGIAATGGAGTGGATGACTGSCSNAVAGACSAPQVRVTSVSLGSALSYSTDETYNIPLAIAAKPGGGSLIAWMTGYSHYGSSTTSQIHVAELDCDDKLVGTPFTFAGHDFQDVAADGDGGVITLTRDGEATGDAQHCGDVNKLCGLPSDRPGCYDHYMVRFDCAGTEQWATKLTTTTASAPLYTSGSGSNHGVWWYQHQGRLAYDGTNYAAYFCDSITIANGSCVDIHEGDRMQVVGPTGSLLTGHDSFAGGCSHSWTTRIVWDPRTKHFVTVCATDRAPFGIHRSPSDQVIVTGSSDGTMFGGDVVNAGDTGYWMAWSNQGKIKLEHFNTGASDNTVTTAGTTQNPHLVALGSNYMLLTWGSGSGLAAQVYDTTTGATVGSQFAIAAPDHPWQSWKPYPDGSAAYAATGSASATIQVARVMPCQ